MRTRVHVDLDVYVKWNFSVNSVAGSCLWIQPGVVDPHPHQHPQKKHDIDEIKFANLLLIRDLVYPENEKEREKQCL